MERHKKPLPRFDRMSETVFDDQIELCCAEQAMEEIFQRGAVQVVQLVGRIRRPVSADFLPGGPVQRTVDYVAPFALAYREADYREAWNVFATIPALNAATAPCPSAGDKDAAG